MNIQKRESLNSLVEQIKNIISPEKIILFGSLVKFPEKADGDIDLLIIVPEGMPKRKTAQLLYSGISNVKTPYDLIIASSSDLKRYGQVQGLIYNEALTNGTVIYG